MSAAIAEVRADLPVGRDRAEVDDLHVAAGRLVGIVVGSSDVDIAGALAELRNVAAYPPSAADVGAASELTCVSCGRRARTRW